MTQEKQAESILVVAEEEHANKRLDRFLAELDFIQSRSKAAKLIEARKVKINNTFKKASYLIEIGDSIDIQMPQDKISTNVPTPMPLDIFFEDQDLIVLNKPAGLVVHPATGHQTDTLVNGLLAHTKDLSMGINEERPGIVHRIDKDTSGLLVVAKNDHTHRALATQFKEKSVHRVYWAIVYGCPKVSPFKIVSQLARHPKHRKKFASTKTELGKQAITHGEVLEKSTTGLSLVKLQLETGRTHQIRVHLSEMHTPIVGDDLYGNIRRSNSLNNDLKNTISNMKRFALHATELGFFHPRIGKKIFFSVGWPNDLLPLIKHGRFGI